MPDVRRSAARITRVAIVGALAAAAAAMLPAASAGAAAQAPGTGKPPAGSGINTPAAMDGPLCDKNAGPYGRLNFVFEGFGPVCVVAWKQGENNGGATYQGVTKDKIKVVALVPNDQQMAAVTATQRPVNYATGQEGTVTNVLKDGLAPFEHVFGGTYMYGRHIELDFVTSTGDDEPSQRADAVTVKAMKPFVVLDNSPDALDVFDEAIAAAKIPVFSLYVTVEQTLTQAPYRWGQQDPIAGSMNAAEFVGKELLGKKAVYAGDPGMHGTTRKFGVVRSSVIDDKYFNETLSKYGVKIAPNATISYPGTTSTTGDPSVEQEFAPVIVTKLKSAGVTSIILLADGGMTGALTKQATAQDYHPEWIYAGSFNIDFPVLARAFYDQDQWAHAFGISNVWPGSPTAPTSPPNVVQWYWGPNEGTYQITYTNALSWLFSAIMYAGPKLTPQTVKQGFFSVPAVGGSADQPGDRQPGRPIGIWSHQWPPVRRVHAGQQGLRPELVGPEHQRTAVARLPGWQGRPLVRRQRQALLRRPLAHEAREALRQVELDLPVRRARRRATGRAVHGLPERDRTRTAVVVIETACPAPARQPSPALNIEVEDHQ